MTLKDVAERLTYVLDASSSWAHCEQCSEEVAVNETDLRNDIAALRLDIERYLLKTEGTL